MPSIAEEFPHYAEVDSEFLANAWVELMVYPTTKAYGLLHSNEWKGFLLGGIQPELLTGKLQGVEFLWCVQRGFRGHALKLLKRFESDCKAAGANWIVVGATALADPQARGLLYQKIGFAPHGSTWFKRF